MVTDGAQDRGGRRAALDDLRRLASSHPPLDDAATAALLRDAVGGAAAATELLVAHHLWLVRDAVLALAPSNVPVADLFQEGSAGLVLGLQRHLAAGGTAAGLAGALRDAVDRELADAEAHERDARQEEARWVADSEVLVGAQLRLRREKGRDPTTGEIAVLLHWEEERVDRVREMASRAQSSHDVDLLAIIAELEEDGSMDGDEGD